MKEVLLNMLSGALATVGELKLIEALQLLKEKDPTQYEAAIRGGHALCKALKPLTDKSKTPIDDAILESLADAVTQSAAANGIEL